RVPVELILDQGIGDLFSVRVAGNIVGTKTLASLEYAVAVSGVKLVLVLGHTRCGAITSSIDFVGSGDDVSEATGCHHLGSIVQEVAACVTPEECQHAGSRGGDAKSQFVDEVVRRNVVHTSQEILKRSEAIAAAVASGQTQVMGAVYDISTGMVEFFQADGASLAEAG
ncbi:MAG: carbonic anhydrase, partial [Planctomycetota bacterium]